MTVPSDRRLDPRILSSTDEDFYTMTALMLGPKIDMVDETA